MKFKDVVRENARQVALLSRADLKKLMPVLAQARERTARDLADWLKKANRDGTYTVAVHRQLLSSLDSSIEDMRHRLAFAVRDDLQAEAQGAALKSLKAMRRTAMAGAAQFEDSATPLRFRNAQIVLSSTRSLMSQHEGSALRYAGRQGDDIRRQLAVGLIRGERLEDTVSRLMRKPRILSDKMSAAEAGDAIAERMFFRSRADARRLVMTENIHAANAAQMDALMEDNERADESEDDVRSMKDRQDREDGDDERGERKDDSEDSTEEGDSEGGWLLRWDATFDSRTCDDCADLDGEVRVPGEEFLDGCLHPPLHPHCRCAVVPWREGWQL